MRPMMRSSLLFICSICASCYIESLRGQEKEARQAERYVEAQEYHKALDLYETLLKQTLTPWQHSAVEYNIGYVLLAEGQPRAAAKQWSEIPVSQDSYPLLTRRIDTNIALARLRQVQQIALDNGPAFDRATFLLQEALAFVKR